MEDAKIFEASLVKDRKHHEILDKLAKKHALVRCDLCSGTGLMPSPYPEEPGDQEICCVCDGLGKAPKNGCIELYSVSKNFLRDQLK